MMRNAEYQRLHGGSQRSIYPPAVHEVDLHVDVHIGGAVRHVGRYRLESPATVRAGLDAAGGLLSHDQAQPSGLITVRRPSADGQVAVWRLTITEDPSGEACWQSFPLQSGDLVVFQWQIADPANT